jgi:short-subunit dehydrogenase
MGNRVAAITGASAGLGTVFARKLAAQGYDVLLIARRVDRLQELARELTQTHGVAAEAMAADLSRVEDIDAVAARLAAEPRLAMLVNNAGFGTKGRFWETLFADQVAMHRVHIDATMRLSRAALQSMVPRDEGAVINVSSVAAYFRSPANVSYCATKAWINAFTEGLYLELKGVGSRVTVQALCPGFTYTEFHDAAGMPRDPIPKWLWLTAEDVVEASLAGVRSRKLFVVPGWIYKLVVAAGTKFPVGWRLALEGRSPHTKTRLE